MPRERTKPILHAARARKARSPLGCQIWLEPTDAPERVAMLFDRARESGLGWVRLFLMWPWIEPTAGQWRFDLYDSAFSSAATAGVRIKATLTANSPPWHVGAPGMQHTTSGVLDPSWRPRMQEYIRQCATRYARHAALGQWVLWNEPHGGSERTGETLCMWRDFLRDRYGGDINALNTRWLTGFGDFAEVPWADEIQHAAHRKHFWVPYRADLDYCEFRSWWVMDQLTWVNHELRRWDARTPTCINPIFILENRGCGGTDLSKMAGLVDVLGASTHPPFWGQHVSRPDYPGLIHTAVRSLRTAGAGEFELTEVQSGNTTTRGTRPSAVTPSELARFYLAALCAGASSAVGWSLNTRSRDIEAGDWGLLTDMDGISDRAQMLARLSRVIERAVAVTGPWSAAPDDALIALLPAAQAIEWKDDLFSSTRHHGRLAGDSAHGQQLLAQVSLKLGLATSLIDLDRLPSAPPGPGAMLVVSHVVAWDVAAAKNIVSFARAGGTVVIDAFSGRKSLDAALHRPWPGGLAGPLGLVVEEMESSIDGFELLLDGCAAGRATLARTRVRLDPTAGWRAWPMLRFGDDHSPAVVERPLGKGRVVYCRFAVGPSLVADPGQRSVARLVLDQCGRPGRMMVCGGLRGAAVIPVSTQRGRLVAVLTQEASVRRSGPLSLCNAGTPGDRWNDLYSSTELTVDEAGELWIPAADGIALLWRSGRQ